MATPAPPPGDDAAAVDCDPDQRSGLVCEVVIEHAGWAGLGDVAASITVATAALARSLPACAGAAATIVLAGDAAVRAMNRRWRGEDQPTNVLAFPFTPPPGMPDAGAVRYLGDVVLAYETVTGEARAQAIPPAQHLQHLVLHGLLHLLGFDHDTDATARSMEEFETRVLAGIGVADPHAASHE